MEYEDSPSKYVTLYNYKEPLMKFESGHGFQGVLLYDEQGETVQCHICGKWFKLLHAHVRWSHQMSSDNYKDMVGLRRNAALMSEATREKFIAHGKAQAKHLQPLNGVRVYTPEMKAKAIETMKRNVRQSQNERGTCPEQLVDRLRKKYFELGRTPRREEIGIHRVTINRVWGSMENLCKAAGIAYREPSRTISQGHDNVYQRHVERVRLFFDVNKRFPMWQEDVGYNNFKFRYLKGEKLKEFQTEVLHGDGKVRRSMEDYMWQKDGIMILMKAFVETHNRLPTRSDVKRKLLPKHDILNKHFGGFDKAVEYLKNEIGYKTKHHVKPEEIVVKKVPKESPYFVAKHV